ncbi:phosphatidic acid phosphatase type 2/haloperoxidase [Tricladium varicosporioides]|nr:phosphatidic acid phosphatase type 2/haloperoxidase [Hymenoscyphus varicosporioides]
MSRISSSKVEFPNPNQACLRHLQIKTYTSKREYLRIVWVDYFCILALMAVTVSIWRGPTFHIDYRIVPMRLMIPSDNKSIQMFQPPLELDYPWRPEPISSVACALVVTCIPIIITAIFQIRKPNVWDFHASGIGVLKAVVATTFVCTVLKQVIGGFRPHFIDICKPDMAQVFKELDRERYWFNSNACTGESYDIKKAMQSFPSGHSANSFAAGTFLSLYINAKLKAFANYTSEFWIFIVTLTPILGASLIAGSMYLSNQHHGEDIGFGLIIGVSIGMLAYRSGYSAVFDWRYNHVPLLPMELGHTTRKMTEPHKDSDKPSAQNCTEVGNEDGTNGFVFPIR